MPTLMKTTTTTTLVALLFASGVGGFSTTVTTTTTTRTASAFAARSVVVVNEPRRRRPPSALAGKAEPLRANLAVRLDRPVIDLPTRSVSRGVVGAVASLLAWDAFGAATACFALAFLAVVVAGRVSSSSEAVAVVDEDEDDEDDVVASRRARVAGALSSLASSLVDAPRRLLSRGGDGDDVVGVPMEFPNEGGWGVATLAAATPLGESNYARYEMALPRPDHSLAAALRMGQRLELCCLDEDGAVSKGAFHPCSDVRRELGKVSFVARRDAVPTTATSAEDDDDDKDRFARVLQHHLAVGDEVALRPAPGDEDDGALSYRGPHLPVTDMVYVARADGVVPVARQIAAVLPAGSSSVRSVTVLWLNDDPRDFLDVVYDELERLHGRHRDRLEVSCVVTSLDSVFDGDDPEVRDAVPVYRPGGMAVVAGPPAFRERVSEWLRTGPPSWPEDCLCVLP